MIGRGPFIAALCAATLAGCANFTSIGRTTQLPPSKIDGDDRYRPGTAIHLDIKQRVVLTKGGLACAEPSPDALSSIAASISGGVAVTGQGSGAAAGALTEAAASVGLRTQSITLMRDALYRICEAYYNGKISDAQAMVLLARSQDLTAAVVSVEQLTGAVVAQQAALGGTAGGASSASLFSNAAALAQIRALEKKYTEELAAATLASDQAKQAVETKSAEVDGKQDEIDTAPATPPEVRQGLEREHAELKDELTALQQDAKAAQDNVKLKQDQLDDITKTRTAIESNQDSSIAAAAASATGTASLSGGSTVSRLDRETAKAISNAVVLISQTVLTKDYTSQECMALFTSATAAPKTVADMKEICFEVIKAKAAAATATANLEAARAQSGARKLMEQLQAQ